MQPVAIWTDGACIVNPGGAGGWAFIVKDGPHEFSHAGGDPATTNNRMELQAAIEALYAVGEIHRTITVWSDSRYLVDGMNSWRKSWKKRDWHRKGKLSDGTKGLVPVKNADLWRELDWLDAKHKVQWEWVRGHNCDVMNEQADQLAQAAAFEARAHPHLCQKRILQAPVASITLQLTVDANQFTLF